MPIRKLVGYALVLVGVVVGIVLWRYSSSTPLTYPQAVARLNRLGQQVTVSTSPVARKTLVQMDKTLTLQDTLPAISKFALVVDPPVASGEVSVEIFASVEKAGKGTDGWMIEVANNFNRSNVRLRNGQVARVKLRAIASGEGYQFIAARK